MQVSRQDLWFGSIPMFAGALVFMPACNDDTTPVTGDASTSSTSSDTTTDATQTTSSTTTTLDESSSTTIETTGDTVDPPACVSCSAEPEQGWFGPVTYARTAPSEPQPACPIEAAEPGPTLLDGFVDPGPAICSCACDAPKPKNCYAYAFGGGGGYSDTGYVETGGDYGSGGYVPETGWYGSTGGFYGSSDGGFGPGTDGDDDFGGNDEVGGGFVSSGYGGTDPSASGGYGGTGYYGATSEGGYYGGTTGGYYGGSCWGNYTQISAACQNITFEGGVRFYAYSAGYGGGGACEKQESTDIPPVAWASTITTCRIPAAAPPCDEGGICIPAPPAGFEQKWCLYRDGDHECTNPEYPAKTVFWSGTDDDRECSDCSCGTSVQSCEEAELLVFAEPDCAGEPSIVLPANGECVEIDAASVAGDFGFGDTACPVTEAAMPEGSVAPSGAFTFCCSE